MWPMLAFGTVGMLLGLCLDARRGGLLQLTSWCGLGDGAPWQSLRLHWLQLPAMHAGMLLGSLCALPLAHYIAARPRAWKTDVACSLACCACMAAGMDIAAISCSRAGGIGANAMWWLMFAGMLAGMAFARFAVACAASMRHRVSSVMLRCSHRFDPRV